MATDEDQPSPGVRHGRIQVSAETFDQLAAGAGSPEVSERLWSGQRSRRLVLLRAFLDEAREDPAATGPLEPVERAWLALERAQRRAPDAVAAVLMHPQVGGWLAYTVRRHRGGAASDAPPWADFGGLHALALSACASARVPYRTSVPLRGGRVMLPTRGMASFGGCGAWDVAEARTEGGRIWLRRGDVRVDVPADGADAPGWWALRRVTVGDEVRLTVWLDDLDPMRDLADPVPPARLSPERVRRWTALLREAWAILVERHRPVAEALTAGVTSLVPLPSEDGWDTRSASSGDAFGAIMCSLPPDAVTLAVSMAHEFMHIKLGGLMHLVPLTDGPGPPCLYAPWRDDPRPAGGLLQGIYAFFGIARFWRDQRGAPGHQGKLLDFEYVYAREQCREALEIALRDGSLTEAGRRFLARLRAELDAWSGDAVDAEAAGLAGLVADAHRAGWRIRHRRLDDDQVIALAKAWHERGREPAAPPWRVQPDPAMRRWSSARLGLARRRLAAPARYAAARDEPWGAALSAADLDLFAGDPAAAARGFGGLLGDDPANPDAWTGLGLALARGGGDPLAAAALLDRPDLVRALHRELGAAGSPTEVAAWAGGLATAAG